MDKEQAIDLLDNLIGMIEDNQDNDYDAAFRMAIESLKAQLSCEGATSDLISRQAAIDGKISIQRANGVEIYYDEAVPVGYLKRLPTIQPERAEGEWINTNPEYKNGFYNNSYYCSQCHDYYTTSPYEMKFCPNCGAKMKGE